MTINLRHDQIVMLTKAIKVYDCEQGEEDKQLELVRLLEFQAHAIL